MSIVNKEIWDSYVNNNKDAYGKCCVDVAREVMRLLDEDNTPLHEGYHPDKNTPHGLICLADDNIEAGGITGFMAGAVATMVSQCHSRGEEFRKIWNHEIQIGTEGDEANKNGGVLNPAILNISKKD